MHDFTSDVRYGLRMLRRSPGFTAIAVIALALGIGANTAIFTAVDTVLLRPLPYPDADRLVVVWEDAAAMGFPRNTPAPANFFDWQKQNTVFTGMGAVRSRSANLTGDGAPELVLGNGATASLFPVLGIQPFLGRAFTDEEDRRGAKVVVISHGLWQRRYGRDRSIVGRAISMDGEPYTVVGVLPPAFNFPTRRADFFWPSGLYMQAPTRGSHFLQVVARLNPGVSIEQAQTEMNGIAKRLEQAYPATNTTLGAVVVPLREQIAEQVKTSLIVLLVAAACVLLIACSNVANLLLAKSVERRRELAVRSALGAGKVRLVRQMLTESVLLAGVAGVLGLGVGYAGTRFLEKLVPAGLPGSSLAIDTRILVFASVATFLTGILFGSLPALRSTGRDLNEALKQGSRSDVGFGRRSVRDALIVSEVALALVLLVGAGLMIQTLNNMRTSDVGFRTDHLLTMRLALPENRYADDTRRRAFFEQVIDSVRQLPGVRSAAFAGTLPFTSRGNTTSYLLEGQVESPKGNFQDTLYRPVTRDYFSTVGARIVAGRPFATTDRKGSQPVVVINEFFARLHWRGTNPLGHRIRLGRGDDGTAYTIVGVVADIRERGLETPMKAAAYLPIEQDNVPVGAFLAVRTEINPVGVVKAVGQAVAVVDAEQPMALVRTMEDIVEEQLESRHLQMILLIAFAALALVLASVGIYGVLSYLVTQRTREIGLRMALGASSRDITAMVLARGAALTGVGLATGSLLAFVSARAMRATLYDVSPADPLTYAGVCAVLAMMAMIACYVPALRAARVEPMISLRQE